MLDEIIIWTLRFFVYVVAPILMILVFRHFLHQ